METQETVYRGESQGRHRDESRTHRTPRVWPGAVLIHGEIAGIWRRDAGNFTILAWRPLSLAERKAVEAEVAMLPLPESRGLMRVRWTG